MDNVYYTVRFWNEANECIHVCGNYSHSFPSWEDAWSAANAMINIAASKGANAMDINNDFYPIEDD